MTKCITYKSIHEELEKYEKIYDVTINKLRSNPDNNIIFHQLLYGKYYWKDGIPCTHERMLTALKKKHEDGTLGEMLYMFEIECKL